MRQIFLQFADSSLLFGRNRLETGLIEAASTIGTYSSQFACGHGRSQSRHRLIADEGIAFGRTDVGPNSYELLLMAPGARTSITLRLYAKRKQWPLEGSVVRLKHTRTCKR